MGDGGGREREGEGQVDQTKHRKHKYISSRCPTPSSVAFVIGICSVTCYILQMEPYIGDRLYCNIESYIGKYHIWERI